MTDSGSVGDPPAAAPLRLWGGRFEGGPAAALAALSASVHFDWRLAPYDLMSSRAHARVLHRAGLLDDDELRRMVAALDDLDAACQSGAFVPTVADEDVHTALERGLIERLGPLGGKLRAGRSRNDQIATDLRLYLRAHVRLLVQRLVDLETALVDVGQRHQDAPAPGMTHLQHAQPVLLPTTCSRTSRPSRATSTGCATGTCGPPSPRWVPAHSPDPRCHSTLSRRPTSSASRRPLQTRSTR